MPGSMPKGEGVSNMSVIALSVNQVMSAKEAEDLKLGEFIADAVINAFIEKPSSPGNGTG